MQQSPKKIILIIFVICIVLPFLLIDYFECKRDYGKEVNFIVYKIKKDSKGVHLYDKEDNDFPLVSQNFQFLHQVEIGDSIVKKMKNDTVFFYRKNSLNNFPFKRIVVE